MSLVTPMFMMPVPEKARLMTSRLGVSRRAIWLVKICPGREAQQPCAMLVPYLGETGVGLVGVQDELVQGVQDKLAWSQGFNRGAQGVQVNPLNPLPVSPGHVRGELGGPGAPGRAADDEHAAVRVPARAEGDHGRRRRHLHRRVQRALAREPRPGVAVRAGVGHLGVDVEVILTPPCIFCMENHE